MPDQAVQVDCRQFECLESGKILGIVMQRFEINTEQQPSGQDRLLFYELDVGGAPTLKALWLSLKMSSAPDMKLVCLRKYDDSDRDDISLYKRHLTPWNIK